MKKLIVKHWRLLLAVITFPIGSRIFNHVNSWLGVAIILTASIYITYKLFNFLKDETKF